MGCFENIGVIHNQPLFDSVKLGTFVNGADEICTRSTWINIDIIKLYFEILPEFAHKETGKYLDQRV